MFDPSQPPLIPETLLKKRRSLDELALQRSEVLKTQNKRKRVVRGENVTIKRPEQFVKESRIKEGSNNKMNRRKRKIEKMNINNIEKESIKDSVGFVVRIHTGRHASPEIKTQLRSLGLIRKYDGIFMKLDAQSIAKLKPIDAYVAYGYITQKSVHELIHRRAYTEFGGRRKILSDNITVEKALGSKGILCLSDLVHELFSVGSHFQDAVGILTTFRLSAPVGHFEKNILHIHENIESKGGFIGDSMDEFLNKIL